MQQVGIGIDTAVAQEWPDAPDVLTAVQADRRQQDFGLVCRCLGQWPLTIAEIID